MVSVLHCKFLKIYERKKSDNTKFYFISVLDENENNIKVLNFFIDNQLALNCKDLTNLQNIAVSFDIWFSTDGSLRYKLKQIVIEK